VKPIWYPLTVFYNGSCPACAGEVEPLKRIEHKGRLVFVDCSAPQFDEGVLAGLAIRRADLMARVHARDAHGCWHTGMGALEAAYRAAYSGGAMLGSEKEVIMHP
jgi:predicted DCC family thiol-disulfide oxidoreductase YuxK